METSETRKKFCKISHLGSAPIRRLGNQGGSLPFRASIPNFSCFMRATDGSASCVVNAKLTLWSACASTAPCDGFLGAGCVAMRDACVGLLDVFFARMRNAQTVLSEPFATTRSFSFLSIPSILLTLEHFHCRYRSCGQGSLFYSSLLFLLSLGPCIWTTALFHR